MRFVFLPNKIELIALIELGNQEDRTARVQLIELTEQLLFDFIRLSNQSNNNPTD